MKHNLISLGQRTVHGNYNRVLAAGELKVQNSRIRRLSCVGMTQVTKSSLGKVRCAGEFIAEEIEFTRLNATGDLKLNGICKGDTVISTGAITAQYLESRILCNGTGGRESKRHRNSTWQGVFHAETFENYNGIYMDFEYRIKNIISYAELISGNDIEGEVFYSFSDLCAKAINADRIFILTQGEVKVDELVGEVITVMRKYQPEKRFKKLPKTRNYRHQNVKNTITNIGIIEADHVEVEYVKAERISGDDVIIGDLCMIEYVEYRHSIIISEKAIVNEVVKL